MARQIVGYGLSEQLPRIFPSPVIAKRNPGTADINFPLGQNWINSSTNAAYVLTSVAAGAAFWVNTVAASGASFTTLTSTGATTLATTGASVNSFGNTTGATSLSLLAGTGGLFLDGAATTAIDIGNSLVGGVITIGGTGASTGNFILAPSTGAQTITLGNLNGAKTINIGNGISGNTISIGNGANTSVQVINIADGASAANSTVNILSGSGSAGAGVLALGNNTRVTTIDLGNIAPAAARVTTINGGNSAQNDSVAILNGNPSAGTQSVSILSGTATGGTQTLNLGNAGAAIAINIGSGAGVATIDIGSGAAANVLTIGSNTGAASLALKAGTGGMSLSAAGAVSMVPATDIQASPSAASTLNERVGSVTFTGFTTASAGKQAFVITNSTVLATSAIFCTVSNVHNVNDAQMELASVVIAAAGGSFTVNATNVGAGALDGNVIINFWVIS